MKFLLLVVVIVFAGWLVATRRRGPRAPGAKSRPAAGQPPAAMIACTHCGLHVPQPDTVVDGQGRRYCSDAHRLAGPG